MPELPAVGTTYRQLEQFGSHTAKVVGGKGSEGETDAQLRAKGIVRLKIDGTSTVLQVLGASIEEGWEPTAG